MKRGYIAVIFVLVLLFVSGCGPSEADLAATDDAIKSTEDAQGTLTMSAQQTSEFATQEFLTQAANTAQALTAEAATAEARTATAAYQATISAYNATQAQSTVVAQTQEAARIYDIVQSLYDAGYINQTSGTFQQLPYFEYSFAQIGWLQRVSLPDSEVRDFVIVMDVSWESASRSANFDGSGCGIAYRVSDDQSEYYAYMLSLDGKMNFFRLISGYNYVYLNSVWYGSINAMEGSSTYIIVAEGTTYQVFNENLERIDLRYGEELLSGHLEYVIGSGTNADFGTRCVFNDVELWRFDD